MHTCRYLELGEIEPPIILLKVDLPEPLMPTQPITSPSCAVTLSRRKMFYFVLGINASLILSLLFL